MVLSVSVFLSSCNLALAPGRVYSISELISGEAIDKDREKDSKDGYPASVERIHRLFNDEPFDD
jgi:hypothetical protein